jgi:hypothetical protein
MDVFILQQINYISNGTKYIVLSYTVYCFQQLAQFTTNDLSYEKIKGGWGVFRGLTRPKYRLWE